MKNIFKIMKTKKELKKWRKNRDYAMNKMKEDIADDELFFFWASSCAVANIEILKLIDELK